MAAVKLYQSALSGVPPAAGSADAARLARAVATLEECLAQKVDEADAFAEAAGKGRTTPLMDGGELTEQEKLNLGRLVRSAYQADQLS